MNTSGSNEPIKGLGWLWRRFQYWRAMRIYARLKRWATRGPLLKQKADRLIGKNVRPPMPLFDRDEGKR